MFGLVDGREEELSSSKRPFSAGFGDAQKNQDRPLDT